MGGSRVEAMTRCETAEGGTDEASASDDLVAVIKDACHGKVTPVGEFTDRTTNTY